MAQVSAELPRGVAEVAEPGARRSAPRRGTGHGEIDDLEPYANLQRLAPLLGDLQVLALPGLGHFGPWLGPDVVLGLLSGE